MDSMKKSFNIAFDKQLLEFNQQLIDRFPEDNKEFKIFKNGFRLLKTTSSEGTIHRLFKKHIEEYRIEIESRNESFFLNNKYEKLVNSDANNSGDINQIINKLKTLWVNLNDEEKTKIWDYFTLLLKLSDKIASL